MTSLLTISTRELALMGRRRFIETLTAIGLSASTVSGMTKEKLLDLTDDPTDRVPRAKAIRLKNPDKWEAPPFPEREPQFETEYTTIPRDKWVRMESAYDASERIKRKVSSQFDSNSKIDAVTTGVTREVFGQHEQYAVRVGLKRVHGTQSGIYSNRERDELVDSLKEIARRSIWRCSKGDRSVGCERQ